MSGQARALARRVWEARQRRMLRTGNYDQPASTPFDQLDRRVVAGIEEEVEVVREALLAALEAGLSSPAAIEAGARAIAFEDLPPGYVNNKEAVWDRSSPEDRELFRKEYVAGLAAGIRVMREEGAR